MPMHDKAIRLPKNLIYPAYYRLKGDNYYFWDKAFKNLDRLYKNFRSTNELSPVITIQNLVSINRSINQQDIKILSKLSKLCLVKCFLIVINNENHMPITTLKVIGTQTEVKYFLWFASFIINNRLKNISELSKQYRGLKLKIKGREPWRWDLIPHAKAIASQQDKLEFRLFNERLKNLLEAQSRSHQRHLKKEVDIAIKNHIKLNRMKLIPLTLKNYERFIKSNFDPYRSFTGCPI